MPAGAKFFKKSESQKALNHVLTFQNAGARRELSIDVLYVTRASICVELWPFYCSKRILLPMSYITFFDNLAVLVPYMSYIVYFHKLSNYMGKRQLRIQECQFLKSAWNLVLIGQNARSRCADFAGIFILEKGVFCVEL